MVQIIDTHTGQTAAIGGMMFKLVSLSLVFKRPQITNHANISALATTRPFHTGLAIIEPIIFLATMLSTFEQKDFVENMPEWWNFHITVSSTSEFKVCYSITTRNLLYTSISHCRKYLLTLNEIDVYERFSVVGDCRCMKNFRQ